MVVPAQLQTVGTQFFYLQTDIIERPETEGVLHQCRILWNAIDRIALYEQTVARVLEIAVQLIFPQILYPDDGTRKADILRVGARQSPLPPQIAGIAALLTGEKEDGRCKKEDGRVFAAAFTILRILCFFVVI